MDLCWRRDRCIDLNLSVKLGSSGVKVHLKSLTLRMLNIGSGQCSYFPPLEGSVNIVEALRSCSSGRSEILECLELPVSPTIKILIANFSDLTNLSCALFGIDTSTKFTQDKWNTQSLGIFISGSNPLLMGSHAFVSHLWGRLTIVVTFTHKDHAAIVMIVEDVVLGSNFTTWWSAETKIKDVFENRIWELSWLEVHDVLRVGSLVLLEDFRVHRSKVIFVKITWPKGVHEIFEVLSGEEAWFIEWIEPDDIWVRGELVTDELPVGDILVLHTELILVNCSEEGLHFRSCVVHTKEVFHAVFDQRITVGIFSEAVVFDRLTGSKMFRKWSDEIVSPRSEAIILRLRQDLSGVEVWHTFTASGPRKQILVVINKGVDALFSKLIDEIINFFDISLVVLSRSCFNCLPHDAESDKVETPGFEICDISGIKGVMNILWRL